jgi:hypothetical protein
MALETTSPSSRCARETSRHGGGFTYTVLDPGIRDVMGACTSIRLKTERTMPKSVLGSGRHAPTLISRCGVLFPTGWRLTPGPSAASCARRAAKPALFAAPAFGETESVGSIGSLTRPRRRENGFRTAPLILALSAGRPRGIKVLPSLSVWPRSCSGSRRASAGPELEAETFGRLVRKTATDL